MAKNIIINNAVYNNVPVIQSPRSDGQGMALFYDTSTATATSGDVLTGKTTFGADGLVNGSMPENGSTSGTISTKAGTVVIPAGHTTGGTVSIATAQQDLLVSGNIKSGVTILGVQGGTMIKDTTISSSGATTSTIMSGYKAYVNGALVTGEATVPTVSQDTTTGVLTIS